MGQLGRGEPIGWDAIVGGDPNDMGDNLAYVDLGSDFVCSYFADGSGYLPNQICAVSTEDKVKCWGRNDYGQLGIGDTTNRGETAAQMGDSLPYLNLSWPITGGEDGMFSLH